MHRIANEENALDRIKGGTCQTRQHIYSCGGTLGIAFEYKAFVCVGGESGVNLVKDLERERLTNYFRRERRTYVFGSGC